MRLVYLLLFLLLIPTVLGIPDPTAYWRTNEASGNLIDTGTDNKHNATPHGTPVYQVTGPFGSEYGVNLDTSSAMNLSWGEGDHSWGTNLTIIGWFNISDTLGNGKHLMSGYKSAGGLQAYIMYSQTTVMSTRIGGVSTGSDYFYTDTQWSTLNDDKWHLLTWTFAANGTVQIYKDAKKYTMSDKVSATSGGFPDIGLGGILVDGSWSSLDGAELTFSNLAIFENVIVNEADINLINGSGGADQYFWDGTAWTTGIVVTMNLSVPYPVNGTGINTSNYNFTIVANSTLDFNCSFYLNGTEQLNFLSGSGSRLFHYNATFNNNESDFVYKWVCTNNQEQINSSEITVRVDTIRPNLYSNFDTDKRFGITHLTGQINATDNYLYGFNVSLDDQNVFNITGLSTTFYSYNLSVNVSNFTGGLHTITACAWDAHTSQGIPDYQYEVKSSEKALKYVWGSVWVQVTPDKPNNFVSVGTHKEHDRYVFEYARANSGVSEELFYVDSNEYIDIIMDSEYQGHLVIPSANKWLDFNTEQGYNVKVIRKSPYRVQIEVEAVTGNDLIFRSVGDLNVVCRSDDWDRVNVTSTGLSYGVEKTVAGFNLTIDHDLNYNWSAILQYSGVNYTASGSGDVRNASLLLPWNTNNTQNYDYLWHYVINGSRSESNHTNTQTFSQYRMRLQDCYNDAYNVTSFTMLFFDEINTSKPSRATYEGVVSIWKNPLYKRNESYSVLTLRHNQSLCIWPPYESYAANGYIDYTNNTATTKRYNIDTNFSNATTSQNLFLVANATAVPVVVTVVDSRGFPVGGVLIKLQRYYAATNSYSEVNQLTTDFQGQARFQVTLYTVEYRFLFEYPAGTLRDTTSKAYIITTSLNYQLLLGDSYLEDPVQTLELYGNVSFHNDTNRFRFYFNDPNNLISGGCLHLSVISDSGTNIVSSNCTNGVSASLYLSTDNNSNNYYLAQGYVYYSNGDESLLSSSSYRYHNMTSFAQGGLWLVIVLTLVILLFIQVSPEISLILLPLPSIGATFFNIIDVSLLPYLVAFEVLCVVVAVVISRGVRR